LIYLVIALLAEAKPIIAHLNLTKSSDKPFKIYSSPDYKLIISGMGTQNASIATAHLLTLSPPTKNDFLFNIGICGAPDSFDIGEAIMINKISSSKRHFYPDMSLRHKFKEASILTVETPQEDKCDRCVDMESSAIFSTALYFLKTGQLSFIKVVSDHFSSKIPTKEDINSWISPHLENFEILFKNADKLREKRPLISTELKEKSLKIVEKLRLSHSQKLQLDDALIYYVLCNNSEPILDIPNRQENKLQRNNYFEDLISSLK